MPSTRPRTSGVRPTYRQPSTAVCHTDSWWLSGEGGGKSSRQITAAETRKVSALTYSARYVGWPASAGTSSSTTPLRSVSPANSTAAIGAEP